MIVLAVLSYTLPKKLSSNLIPLYILALYFLLIWYHSRKLLLDWITSRWRNFCLGWDAPFYPQT